MDYSGYSRLMATFKFSAGAGDRAIAWRTIWISRDLALSVLIVPTLARVGNFIIPLVVDDIAPKARIPGLPRIPLHWEGYLTTKNFIHTVDWYGYFPKDTRKRIFPNGQMRQLSGSYNLLNLSLQVQAIVRVMALVSMEVTIFIFIDSGAPDIGGGAVKVPFPTSMANWLVVAFSPRIKAFVTLIISSTVLGMLSLNLLINPGCVIQCMNPEILISSGAPLNIKLSLVKRSMKAYVDSPSLCFT
ncbi:hypothetical protein Tco_0758405 [Tanacetum coccineum]